MRQIPGIYWHGSSLHRHLAKLQVVVERASCEPVRWVQVLMRIGRSVRHDDRLQPNGRHKQESPSRPKFKGHCRAGGSVHAQLQLLTWS